MTHPLFLYGTLRHLPLLETLIGGVASVRPAVLPGHRVVRWPDVENPYLEEHGGAEAPGLLLDGLSALQRARLDLYEVPFGYFPQVRSVQVEGRMEEAAVYYPDASVPRSDQLWSLEAWASRWGDVAVEVARELALYDPPLQAEPLTRQWGMILSRAESRVRAAQGAGPATLRYDPKPADFDWQPLGAPPGQFFRLGRMELSHRQFDGTRSDRMVREVLVGVDAVLVVPYDAARERVLLVEQFRPGPAWRHDPNPWSLEPVAGIVDGGETPEEAAAREGQEEARVGFTRLERMFSMYPSPGSSTDHFFCFAGLADLPSLAPGFGGLAEEHEDLRLHVMDLRDALALVESGEANTGPLIAMLLWIDRHKARLAG